MTEMARDAPPRDIAGAMQDVADHDGDLPYTTEGDTSRHIAGDALTTTFVASAVARHRAVE
jgi:hypothetical protein